MAAPTLVAEEVIGIEPTSAKTTNEESQRLVSKKKIWVVGLEDLEKFK